MPETGATKLLQQGLIQIAAAPALEEFLLDVRQRTVTLRGPATPGGRLPPLEGVK